MPILGTSSARHVTDVRPEHLEKAQLPMLVTFSGIVMDVSPEQRKASTPMLVTLLGIVIDVRPEQSEKAEDPILVTLLGIITEVRLVQP